MNSSNRTAKAYLSAFAAAAALVLTAGGCSGKAKFGGTSLDKVEPVLLLDQSFDVATIGTETTRFKPAFGIIEQSLSLKEKPPIVDTQQQVYRKPLAQPEQFQQGHEGAVSIEDFTISSAAKLDLLVVLDNSSSMATEQTALSRGLPALVSGLSNVDWQIGVITSDAESAGDPIESNRGCHLYDTKGQAFDAQGNLTGAPISKNDPAASIKFTDTIQNIGVGGSNREQLIRNAYRAVTGTCGSVNQDWRRKDALLGILFVTDEDSYCDSDDPSGVKDAGGNTLCKPAELPTTLINALKPPFTQDNQARVYSLTYHGSMPAPGSAQAQRPAARILNVVQTFGGFDDSIQQDDYASTLARISADAATIVKRQFTLKSLPLSDTLQVSVDGVLTTNYKIVGNMLSVEGLSADRVNLHVSYRHDPVMLFNQVTTSQQANPSTLEVKLNDALLTKDQYDFDPATSVIHFHSTPPDYAVIRVNYRIGPDLKSDFVVSSSSSSRPLAVTVDTIPVTDYDWDDASHTLHFKSPPPDGASVAVAYKDPNGKITNYDMAPSGLHALSMDVIDANTKNRIDVTTDGRQLVFKGDDVQDGRTATVTYHFGDSTTLLAEDLAHAPLADSLTLKVDKDGPDCLKNIHVEGQKLVFNCDATTLGELELSYSYLISHNTIFTVGQDVPPGAYIQVFVDGQAYNHYQQDGRNFTIPDTDTTLTSKIRILINTDANGGVRR